ncbi:DUF853 family protein [Galactobacter valiniphilus]|uniref:DUF853 family protein n=1 Tax=Galactobacter valiniphilus TaxID=2676122 RepID=A0A399J7T0_9MICC|nr:helicase HerA-like domain-containing protein [Galactobacter valiniphilus]RII41561.1 DUF853 family protein [Galactobacter valiniphilus]
MSATKSAEERVTTIRDGYAIDAPALTIGAAVVDGTTYADAQVKLPLGMMNRHGLVAGATGTGKTITLQLMAEQLCAAGVPVFLADIKGDLTGLITPGEGSEKLLARTKSVGMDWAAANYPVEFLALGGDGKGAPVRATVTSFGPLLLSRVMDLNETQESSLQLIFHYADQRGLLLDDLKDLRAVISHLTSDEGKPELKELGGLSSATAGVILRGLVNLEAQGLDQFFGLPEFDSAELLRQAPDGRGVITCLELPTLMQKPLLTSTFMMWLLADLFAELPEVGDADKPKLVFFLDEAHLLFNGASKAFLQQIATTVRLIRSKGIGLFFVTQNPTDVPGEVLGQLANRVQHALRAFTPEDAKALKATVSTYPISDYELDEVLTTLGTGEAVVTVMNEKGAPSPVAWTKLWSPRSRMGASDAAAVDAAVAASALLQQYGTATDRESAFERLNAATPASTPDAAAPGDVVSSAPSTGGSVGGALPAPGQSQADIDAEARRIEAEILGLPVPAAPAPSAPSAPAPKSSSSSRSRKKADDSLSLPPTKAPAPRGGGLGEQLGKAAVNVLQTLGNEIVRGMFGTSRRKRR